MNLLVDTSVWSLALRRDRPPQSAEVDFLSECLRTGEGVFTTGIIIQELLQGIVGEKSRKRIATVFSKLGCIVPTIEDHRAAAGLWTLARSKGIQVGTVDAVIAQLAIQHSLQMLTTDRDFSQIAGITPLVVIEP